MSHSYSGPRRPVAIVLLAAVLFLVFPEAKAQGGVSEGDESLQLALPAVPTGLTSVKERADYVIIHYWDAMDFSDAALARDTVFLEQNFVNYMSVAPYAGANAFARSAGELLERSAADSVSSGIIIFLAEKYLGDAGSPMYNEDFYIVFLEKYISLPEIPETVKLRPQAQLSVAKKNRPGSPATDFSYVTRAGENGTLYETEAGMLLVAFYDPACPHCSEILREIASSDIVNKRISEGKLSVLAVYTENDLPLWNETKASMPGNWIVAADLSRVLDNGLYDLPAMPVLYLLGRDKSVVLKDPSPAAVDDYLGRND